MQRRSFLQGLAALALSGASAAAESRKNAGAPAADVEAFKAAPQDLLARFPEGSYRLAISVRELLVADPSLLETLATLAATANSDQVAAIGLGISQATKIITKTDPGFSAKVDAVLGRPGGEALASAYSAALRGDAPMGGGGGVGGPSGGHLPSGGQNSGPAPTSPAPTRTAPSGLTGGSTGGSAGGSTGQISPH